MSGSPAKMDREAPGKSWGDLTFCLTSTSMPLQWESQNCSFHRGLWCLFLHMLSVGLAIPEPLIDQEYKGS